MYSGMRRWYRARRGEPVAVRVGRRLGPVGAARLVQDAAHVVGDGVLADRQRGRRRGGCSARAATRPRICTSRAEGRPAGVTRRSRVPSARGARASSDGHADALRERRGLRRERRGAARDRSRARSRPYSYAVCATQVGAPMRRLSAMRPLEVLVAVSRSPSVAASMPEVAVGCAVAGRPRVRSPCSRPRTARAPDTPAAPRAVAHERRERRPGTRARRATAISRSGSRPSAASRASSRSRLVSHPQLGQERGQAGSPGAVAIRVVGERCAHDRRRAPASRPRSRRMLNIWMP